MKPTVFSYTRLSTFDKCQHQYAERYLRRKTPRHDTIEAFAGNRVHGVIEKTLIGSLASNLPDIWKAYLESWTQEYHAGIVDVRQYGHDYWRDYGQKCLTTYLDKARVPEGWELVGTEYRLGLPLLEQPMASFLGIIDRLIKRTGTDEYVIQDFKTGKMPQRKYFTPDHQLPTYSHLVVRNLGLDPEAVMKCERVYLAHDAKCHDLAVDAERRQQAWHWAQYTAMEALLFEEEIRTVNRVPEAKKQPLCEWCAYRKGERCPVWILSHPGARELL